MRVILLIALAVGITYLLDTIGLFSRIEAANFDHRVELFRADKSIHPDVVVILIDDASLQQMGKRFGRWPWPRNAFAELLDYFSQADVQALAFDVLFTEHQDSSSASDADRQLVAATRSTRVAVHAMQLMQSKVTGLKRPLPSDFAQRFALAPNDYAGPVYDDFLLPFEDLYRASPYIGFLEIKPDRDGVYRRVRLFNQHEDGTMLPSLASAMLLPLLAADMTVSNNLDRATIGEREINLDGNGNYLVNPYGHLNVIPVHQVFQTIHQIRDGQSQDLVLAPDQFAGKLVLLGASAIGLLDVKATSIADAEPGVFLHAYTVSNILQQDMLKPVAKGSMLILLLLVSGLTVLSACVSSRPAAALLMHAIILIAYLGVAYFSFTVNLVLPVFPIVFVFFLALLMAYFVRTYSS